MTENQKMVDRYMDGFRRGDREQILSCLTEDVEWEIPGAFHARGKDAFAEHIVETGFIGKPTITVTRLTEEESDVVVAEGSVRRDQVAAAVNKTGCADPRPASRRGTRSDGARFLVPLVGGRTRRSRTFAAAARS